MSTPGLNPPPQLTGEVATLAALEARRDKTRALKQGLMQKLLTGRTRLV
jgi:type I restriction enzyme S subunit